MKKITVSVPEDVYHDARIAAAERDTSVSALVVEYLRNLSGHMREFAMLEYQQSWVQAEITSFRAGDRLDRDQVHDRELR